MILWCIIIYCVGHSSNLSQKTSVLRFSESLSIEYAWAVFLRHFIPPKHIGKILWQWMVFLITPILMRRFVLYFIFTYRFASCCGGNTGKAIGKKSNPITTGKATNAIRKNFLLTEVNFSSCVCKPLKQTMQG